MTHEQKQFLIQVLSQINVNAADPKAFETAQMVQGIIAQLSDKTPQK